MIVRLASLLLLGWAFGFVLFVLALPRDGHDRTTTDAVVVLTGGAGRIERGIARVRLGQAKRLLVSGVARTVSAAQLAEQTHTPPALFACCIDLGRGAVDTRSNGAETARWIRAHGYRSVRLVTTDWHMARARFELGHALEGDRVTLVPDPVRSEPGLTALVTEYDKYLLRRAQVLVGA